MFGLTQILATSKACQQTGVNLLVTFTMNIQKQASALWKKLEQLKFILDNPDLTPTKRAQLEDQLDAINAQLKAFEQQLTQLRVTKIKRTMYQWGKYYVERAKPSWGYVLGKPFNELLNWPTDCKHTYSTVGWPGEGPLAAKSSAALSKQINII